MEAPIFFVTCVRTGWNAYEAHFREFDHLSGEGSAELLRQYAAFLEEETRAHPSEWHHFHDFFAQRKTSCRTSASTLSRTAQAMS
jgi:predicted LPLAT superfamily acyltransferase